MNDLERSEKIVADVLAKLIEHGLRRINIEAKDFDYTADDDVQLFSDSLFWLEREGIIYGERVDNSILFAGITAHGFSLIGAPSPISDDGSTSGEVIKKIHAGEGQYAKLGSFFGGLLGGLAKSVS